MKRHTPSLLIAAVVMVAAAAALAPAAQKPKGPPDPKTVRIDMRHILEGRVNSRDQLVGLHHEPSAPRTLKFRGKDCDVEFEALSPGGRDDVRTAQVSLVDPRSKRVVAEKFSTLYPDSWDEAGIEAAVREAYADARGRRQINSDGRWQGRTKAGVRIDGFLSYDGTFIASAFPVYVRNDRGSRRR
jgi:hypothetical protein